MIKQFGRTIPARAVALAKLDNTLLAASLGGSTAIRRQMITPTLLNTWDNKDANWAISGGVLSHDTTNYTVEGSTGKQSVKVTKSANEVGNIQAYATYTIPGGPVDLSNTLMRMGFFIHAGTDGQSDSYKNIVHVRIRVTDNVGGTKDFRQWKYNSLGSGSNGRAGYHIWHGGPSDHIGAVGVIDWTNIVSVRCYVYCSDEAHTCAVSFDFTSFIPKLATPILIIRQDDCETDAYDQAAYANSKGVPITFSAPTGCIGETGYCTWAELKLIKAMGHEIVNHSNAEVSLVSLADDQARIDAITEATATLCANGFSEGSRIFVVPGDNWDEDCEAALWPYVDHVSFVRISKNSDELSQMGPLDRVRSFARGYATNARWAAALTAAKADGGIAMVVGHTYNADLSEAQFKTFIDGVATDVAAGNLEVMTLGDYLRSELTTV